MINHHFDYCINSDYFEYDQHGELCVKHGDMLEYSTPLSKFCENLHYQSIQMPAVLHFQHILEHRLKTLYSSFNAEIQDNQYAAEYYFAYPIKVNPKAHILKSLQEHCQALGKSMHYEVGTKTELLAVLGIAKNDSMVICNGFKDKSYYGIANSAGLLGFKVIVVIEHIQELSLVRDYFTLDVPLYVKFGFRVKPFNENLHTLKFGLSLYEIIQAIDLFKYYDKHFLITMLHGHVGSQLEDQDALVVHIRFMMKLYADLAASGIPIRYLDFGGGLGIDYNLSGNDVFCINHYAKILISNCKKIADDYGVAHPGIITESGRAITASAEILLVQPHYEVMQNKVLSEQQSAIDKKWLNGEIDLISYKQKVQSAPIDFSSQKHVWLNFSVFQSLPDQWGINQSFPMLPIRASMTDTQNDVLIFDISCDADGVIKDKYGNYRHQVLMSQDTPLAILYVGAYQNMLSSNHNLIGETNFVFIDFKQNGKFTAQSEKSGYHSTLLTEYGHNLLKITTRLRRRLNTLNEIEITSQQRIELDKFLDDVVHISPYLLSGYQPDIKEYHDEMAG